MDRRIYYHNNMLDPMHPFATHNHIKNEPPLQSEIDAAYSVKVFLDNHPGRHRSITILAHQSGLSEQRLKAAFQWTFNERLDLYWAKMQWKELTSAQQRVDR